jgi:hypothetical protein
MFDEDRRRLTAAKSAGGTCAKRRADMARLSVAAI